MYKITKLFTSGNLKGLTYTFETDIEFELNKTYKGILGTSDYKIISKEIKK